VGLVIVCEDNGWEDANALIQVVEDCDVRREIEIRVQSTTPMIARIGREFPHVVRTVVCTIEAFLDAVAFVLDMWELEYDFCGHACDVEAGDIADTAIVFGFGLEVLADFWETVVVVAGDERVSG